ncbi:MAG: tRNA (adenosine(37)-N6)-dimethylallyltransferase MiaA [Bacteroidota bacterium]
MSQFYNWKTVENSLFCVLQLYFLTNSNQKYLIAVGGATASGKTGLAIRLAQHFQTEILSADSRQFYREMSIGTAKPAPAELAQAPHHFIDSLSIFDPYTVGDFERDALAKLHRLFEKHQVVILAGGSGLFIRAILEGLDDFPEVPEEIKQQLQQAYEEQGLPFLQRELQEKDPVYYEEVDLENPMRVLRALGVIRASGQAFSSFRQGQTKERFFESICVLLDWDRDLLYQRINQRVDLMIEEGLLEEARRLFPHRHLNALQTVGYQELFDHFEGHHDLNTAIELIKRNSRRYAKRQGTWFRKRPIWQGFPPQDWDALLAFILQCMEEI